MIAFRIDVLLCFFLSTILCTRFYDNFLLLHALENKTHLIFIQLFVYDLSRRLWWFKSVCIMAGSSFFHICSLSRWKLVFSCFFSSHLLFLKLYLINLISLLIIFKITWYWSLLLLKRLCCLSWSFACAFILNKSSGTSFFLIPISVYACTITTLISNFFKTR